MLNQILFVCIGILMLAILAVGSAAIHATQTPGITVLPPQTAQSGSSQSAAVRISSAPDITMAQVAKHNSAASCYTTISGSVYDVTTWINQHPGGKQAILSLCGTDGTAAFTAQHAGQRRPATELASFKIGTLAK